MQAYSDPTRANDPHALPDVEVWCSRRAETICRCGVTEVPYEEAYAGPQAYCPSCGRACDRSYTENAFAWWWWSYSPGCLPDGDPIGPFATEAEALADAQQEGE